ncbi:hypothetical protein U27_02783 [Candidatus Vecturithrix granuli]|uniref:Uncharacterized protein n=1 Tax=Vecturithrix granuli TaxID=1499967 RepID=A0A081BU19_VECG1|nr:hypothetical protein U27_02783 [Candidatus Vecturithrix granuli]
MLHSRVGVKHARQYCDEYTLIIRRKKSTDYVKKYEYPTKKFVEETFLKMTFD